MALVIVLSNLLSNGKYMDDIFFAIERGNIDKVKQEIESGLDINTLNRNDQTLLIMAAWLEQSAIAKYLIENNADLDYKDTSGKTALMVAASVNQVDCLANLVNAGADIEAKDNYGWSALHFAATRDGNIDSFKMLLNLGANSQVRTNNRESVYDIAKQRGCKTIMEWIGNGYIEACDEQKTLNNLLPTYSKSFINIPF